MTIFDKCKAVIESCQTPEQMEGALKYVALAFTGHLINVAQWVSLDTMWTARREAMKSPAFNLKTLPKRTDEGW